MGGGAPAELPSASSGPAGLMERQTLGTRSRQGTLARAQTNTVALVSVHVLKCLHFFPPLSSLFSLHANTRADRKEPTDETACVISTRHISKVVCCVITPCLPPAHEIHRLSLWLTVHDCFIFLQAESNIGTSITLPRLRAAAPGLLIYHFLYYFTSLGER